MKKFYTFIIAVLCSLCVNVYAQQLTIQGTVINADDNEAVIGAVVKVQNTPSNAVSTDINGVFSIKANKGDVLAISFFGLETQYIEIQDNSRLSIQMQPSAEDIETVVVTALGIKRSEKALGYSVQNVSGNELQKVKGVDVATSLTGKISGVLVKNSTDFGASPSVLVRGENPLIVIDGVPYQNMTMRDVAADDIESMSVLKGATASALYGYRGANGAIMITTKNGSSGTKGLTVDLSTNTMFSAGYLAIPEKQSLYGRGDNGVYKQTATGSWGPAMDGQMVLQWNPISKQNELMPYLPVGANNFNNYLEQGYITNNNVSIAYQDNMFALRSSLNWTQNKGQYPNSTFDKYSYTIGGDLNLDKFKMSVNAAYHKQTSPNIGFNGYTSYDPMYTLLIWSASDYNLMDYKDYWLVPGVSQNWTLDSNNNPYFDRYQKVKEIDRNIFNTSLNLSYDITDWLKISVRSGLDFYMDRQDIKVSTGSLQSTGNTGVGVNGNKATWLGGGKLGAYATGRTSGWSMNNDLILSFDKTWGDFTVEALAGGTIFYKKDDAMWGNTNGGLSIPEYYSLKASVNPISVGSESYAQQVNSIYGRLGVSWKRTVFVEGTVRNDWSSTLPESTRSYLYPSVAASFVVSELIPDSKKWLDMLKVRGSWTVSKTPAGIYDINNNYNVSNPAWGSISSASYPSTINSNIVRPQSANTFEVGLQGMFFKNRLMVDMSYYDKLMYDFLIRGTISSASGFSNTYINSQEQRSRRGWEVTLNAVPVQTKDWVWNLNLNWSTYATYYTQLDPEFSADNPWVKVGERVDAYVLKDYARDNEGNHIFANGIIQYNPFSTNYGWSDPDWIWGVTSDLTWKDLTLTISVDGRVGGLTNTLTESYMWTSGAHPNSLTEARAKDVANPGSKNFIGNGVKVVSGTVKYDPYGNVISDDRVFARNDVATTYNTYVGSMHAGTAWGGSGTPADCYSTTFFKLRELAITYRLPQKWVSKWAKSVSVGITGQNLLMWAKDFKYSDPDGGVENFSDPSVRYVGFNIKFVF